MNLINNIEKINPRKLIGTAKNFKTDLKYPMFFVKPWETLNCIDNKYNLELNLSDKLKYEAELAILINEDIIEFDKKNHTKYYAGYFHAFDITIDPNSKDSDRLFNFFEFKFSKNSTPYGNFINSNLIENPDQIKIKTKVNNKLIFDTDYKDLLFSIPDFMEYLTSKIKINKGDIILCGAEKMSDDLIQKNDIVNSQLYFNNKILSELNFKIN